jgi:8-oxo-dGTP diphosphatase
MPDHKKAPLWRPTGGHVETGKDPKTTVERECQEEVGVQAEFWRSDPFFLTVRTSAGRRIDHTDVSLWYVLKGDPHATYQFDEQEFNDVRWFHLDDIPYEKSDPYMGRFIEKLKGSL